MSICYLYRYLYLFLNLSTHTPIHPSIYLSERKQLCDTSIYFPQKLKLTGSNSVRLPQKVQSWQPQNEEILRDFFNVWNWERQKKRSSSARFPAKVESEWSAELTASCQSVLRFLNFTCLKNCACHEEVRPGHMKCRTCHANHAELPWQTWRSDAPKCNLSQEISALTS